MTPYRLVALAFTGALLLVACGGSGGGSNAASKPPRPTAQGGLIRSSASPTDSAQGLEVLTTESTSRTDLGNLLRHNRYKVTSEAPVTGSINGVAVTVTFADPPAFDGVLPDSSSPSGIVHHVPVLTGLLLIVDTSRKVIVSAVPAPGSQITPGPSNSPNTNPSHD